MMSAMEEAMRQWALTNDDDVEVYERICDIHDIFNRVPDTAVPGDLPERLLAVALDPWRWDELSWAAQELLNHIGHRDTLIHAASTNDEDGEDFYAEILASHALLEHVEVLRALTQRGDERFTLLGYRGLVRLMGAEVRAEVEARHNLAALEHKSGWLTLLARIPGPADPQDLLRALEQAETRATALGMIATSVHDPDEARLIDPALAIACDQSEDFQIRRAAVAALLRLQATQAIEPLWPHFEPVEDELDLATMFIALGAPNITARLLEADAVHHLRALVTLQLHRGTPEEHAALRAYLLNHIQDVDEWEREDAFEQLATLCPEDTEVFALLNRLLEEAQDPETREIAAYNLARMSLPQVSERLRALLSDESICESVLKSGKRHADATWVPRLLEIVGPPASWVPFDPDASGAKKRRITFSQQYAMLALGATNDPAAHAHILATARAQGRLISSTVLDALQQLEGPEASAVFATLVQEHASSGGLPLRALGALAQTGDPVALARLLEAFETPGAVCADGDDVEAFQNRVAFELGRCGRPEVLDQLRAAAYSRYWDHRNEATRLLGQYPDDPRAVQTLERLTRDRDVGIRRVAHGALDGEPYHRFSMFSEFDGTDVTT